MPIHDWCRVDRGVFHHFHQAWTIELSYALNAGKLPTGYFALAEQFADGRLHDVVTLQHHDPSSIPAESTAGVAIGEVPPRASYVTSVEADAYAERANRIVIKHRLGNVVAVIEIISPGNKSSRHALRSLVGKAVDLIRRGIHLLVVDLFPPSPRDPEGMHKAIWDEFRDEPFELPPDKPLTLTAYFAGELKTAYVERLGIGDTLPALPIFLNEETYVPAPLEESYRATWEKLPPPLREYVEHSDGG